MDSLNFFNMATVSLPEAFFSAAIGFLIIGEKKRLYPNRVSNIARYFSTLLLMVLSSSIIRPLAPNVVVILFAHIVAYSTIFKLTYDTNFKVGTKGQHTYKGGWFKRMVEAWYRPVISALFAMWVLVVIELLYMPSLMMYLQKNIADIYSSNIERLIYTIPERILQLSVAISLWNWDVILVNLKKYKNVRLITTVLILFLLFSEAVFLYAFVYKLNEWDLILKIFLSIAFLTLVAVNFGLFKLVTLITKVVRFEEIGKAKVAKKEGDKRLKIVYNYLNRGEVEKAKQVLRKENVS